MKYRAEKNDNPHINNNWCWQVVGPEGVIARFGKPIPAVNTSVVWSNACITACLHAEELNDK